jgi:hypothetical protein
MTTDKSALLPCPFCARPTVLRHWDDWGVEYGCNLCGFGIEAKTNAEAISAWNTRTQPKETSEGELAQQKAENAMLRSAILHPEGRINPQPKTYGMKKGKYGDWELAELPEGDYVKREDYRLLARKFLARGAEIDLLETGLKATPAAPAQDGLRELEAPANEMFRWLNRLKMDPYTQTAVNDFRRALESALSPKPSEPRRAD